MVRTRDLIKFIGISIIACWAAFVCTLFLNYNIDLAGLKEFILTDAGIAIYNAQVLVGKVIAAVTGGALEMGFAHPVADEGGKHLGTVILAIFIDPPESFPGGFLGLGGQIH